MTSSLFMRFTGSRPPLAFALLMISFLLHGTAVLLEMLLPVAERRDVFSTLAFVTFIAVSFLLAVMMFLTGKKKRLLLALAFHYLLVLVAGFLVGGRLDVVTLLLFAIILEISIYFDHPSNLLLDAVAVAGALLFILPPLFSPPHRRIPDNSTAFVAFTSVSLIGLCGCLFTFYRERWVSFGQELTKMGSVVAELTEANLTYLKLAQSAEERSMLAERRRLTAELHDIIGYTLTNLVMMMEAAQDIAGENPDDLPALIARAREQALHGLEEARRSLRLLREQEVRGPMGLAAVERMIGMFESATGVKVERYYSNFPNTCSPEINDAFFHFVQESLINAFRHGRATRIRVVFATDEEALRVSVTDNGRGCKELVEGIGITGMRERIGNVGGTLTISGISGRFDLTAQIPLKE